MNGTNEIVNPEESVTKTNSSKNIIPADDVTLGHLAQKVADAWATDSSLLLKWTTRTQYSQNVTTYNQLLAQRDTTEASRSPIASELMELDRTINKSISYIKGYIIDKYGKQTAASYYNQFGLYKYNKVYSIPKDRDQRVHSLDLLLAGIENEEFTNLKYGADYWTPIVTKYKSLFEQTGENIRTLTTQVDTKETLKKGIKKTLSAVILLIKANYPDNYTSVLREWGFQKDLY